MLDPLRVEDWSVPDPLRPRSTSIAGVDAPPDEIEGLLALASDCGMSAEQARERMRHVAAALVSWPDRARRNQLSECEITTMAESIEPRLEAVAAAAGADNRARRLRRMHPGEP
ncbi:hypothetical protein [Nocardia jiangsuensis]|uniref:DUF222 domain-containing protein n=1 Tax=Nocardia jiangsuensis TaxID=1691563 RepID=A0ABV8DVN9_9NOCA